MTSSASYPLRELLTGFESGDILTTDFCDRFEEHYNLRTDRSGLSEVEKEAFKELFEVVVWFSPFEDERAQIPSYVGPGEIAKAAEAARAKLAGE